MEGKGQKMNIVICDDERKVIEDVGSICREYLSPDVKLYGFRSAESLLKNLDKIEGDIALFILDIEMPGRDGLWLRKELERYRYGSSIIYLTSHDELVQEAFGRYVIGFVDKVSFLNDKNKLVDKLKLFEQEVSNREVLCIKGDQENLFICKDKIITITAEHVYSYLEYVIDEKPDGKYQLNLWEANRRIFLDAGIKEERISMPGICTCCNPLFLYSHRASHGKRGNLGAFITVR